MIGVLVSGAGTNLQALLDADLPVVAVASNNTKAKALDRAAKAGIEAGAFPMAEFDSRERRDEELAEWLAERGVELVVLAGYMQLLTTQFLERFPGRILNVHPSLLPAFPGAQNSCKLSLDVRCNAQHIACSLPPDPITRIFMFLLRARTAVSGCVHTLNAESASQIFSGKNA